MKHLLLCAAVSLCLAATAARADTFLGSIPLPVSYSGNMPSTAYQTISTQPYVAFDWSRYTAPAGQSLYVRMCMSYTDSGLLSSSEGIWVLLIPYQYNGSNAHRWLFDSTSSSSNVALQTCSNYSDGGATVNGWLSTSALSCLSSPLTSSCTLKAYARSGAASLPVTIRSAWLEVVAR